MVLKTNNKSVAIGVIPRCGRSRSQHIDMGNFQLKIQLKSKEDNKLAINAIYFCVMGKFIDLLWVTIFLNFFVSLRMMPLPDEFHVAVCFSMFSYWNRKMKHSSCIYLQLWTDFLSRITHWWLCWNTAASQRISHIAKSSMRVLTVHQTIHIYEQLVENVVSKLRQLIVIVLLSHIWPRFVSFSRNSWMVSFHHRKIFPLHSLVECSVRSDARNSIIKLVNKLSDCHVDVYEWSDCMRTDREHISTAVHA